MTPPRIHGIKPDIVLRVLYLDRTLAYHERLVPRAAEEERFYAEPDSLELWNSIFGD